MTELYREQFLLRMNGGPQGGTRIIRDGDFGFTWPLPHSFAAVGGRYVKIGESQLGPVPEGSHVLRGAEYRWVEQ